MVPPRKGNTNLPDKITMLSVVAVTLEDRSIPGHWEVRGYPDKAQIRAGRVHDVNTHRWRHIPNGEVIEFLD